VAELKLFGIHEYPRVKPADSLNDFATHRHEEADDCLTLELVLWVTLLIARIVTRKGPSDD